MAKVATAPGSLGLKVGPMVRRKTPSELRGEQLKRTNVNVMELVDESPALLFGSTNNTNQVDNGVKQLDLPRNPRYIDTRMDEVYPIKKSRLRMLSAKENAKENISTEQPNILKNLSVLSNLAAKRRKFSCQDNPDASEVSKDGVVQTCQTIEKCSQSIFRSVTEISSSGDKSSGLAVVDMDKALKGLFASDVPTSSGLTADSSENFANQTSTYSSNFCSEFNVPGQKAPLDFTLKTKMRVASSCSVTWIHRSIMSSTYNGMPQFTSQVGFSEDSSGCSKQVLTSQILGSKALHSWVYPQSTLPPFFSALTSSTADGETDFLRKRQLAWEDSFQSLYYMFRKNICNIFYVCTSHLVVMFTGRGGSGRTKRLCNAYISQSTRSLRSLLRENGVYFSMPLCQSKVEHVTTEDLVELSEIEKQNLGQTRRLKSLSDVDNGPQSLLAFCGNKNVHGLYDFLLNYRSFTTFLSGVDVPLLYSPVPFQNAALSAPEIRCVEMKRDHITASSKESAIKGGESLEGLYSGLCSSVEIMDAYIPPSVICRVCALMGSEERTFEASFTTERTSIGLNFAFGTALDKSDSQAVAGEGLQETSHAFGIPETILAPRLCSGFLKGLKYSNGSYMALASLTPL